MIDLYFWTTDNGYKARLMIEETGLAYRLKPVALSKREQFSPEFLKINPGHKIPAIVDYDGPGGTELRLFESGAILKYLAEKAGNGMYPSDPARRVQVDQWLFHASSTFTPIAQQLSLFLYRFGEDLPPAKKHYAERYGDLLAIMDKHLANHRYLAGDYSAADVATYPDVAQHERLGFSLDSHPHLKRWHGEIASRPAVGRAWAPIE